MKPRSAPEKGAFVPPSRSRIAGTEPAPMKTSNAVPTASAKARWAVEKDSISDLLPALAWEAASRFRGFRGRRRPGTIFVIVEHRSENVRHHTRACQARGCQQSALR